ncbi:MAG: permease [Bacteroidota bacterium]
MLSVLRKALQQTSGSLVQYLPYLAAGILLAAAVQVYVDRDKVLRFMRRTATPSIFLVTLVGALTPFCSCGTMAVVLSMLASAVPWGPVVAFMVSSPLMSPSGFVYTGGLMGWDFAGALLAFSILLGIGAGYIANALEKRGFLKDQARFRPMSCGCAASAPPDQAATCGANVAASQTAACGCAAERRDHLKLRALGRAVLETAPRILGLYLAFSFIGHLLMIFIPSQWLLALFGQSKLYAVPLAATVGLPNYLNAEASMPLIRSFMAGGMSHGSALALVITGAGTSVGAISGAFVIARRRVVGLVVFLLWAGAILAGYTYDLAVVLR